VKAEWKNKLAKFITTSSPLRSARKCLHDEKNEAKANKILELEQMHENKVEGYYYTPKHKLYLDPTKDTEVNKAKLAFEQKKMKAKEQKRVERIHGEAVRIVDSQDLKKLGDLPINDTEELSRLFSTL
jgi:hypothetical protein